MPNNHKTDSRVIKFKGVSYEVIKRIYIYLQNVDRHFESKYNQLISDVTDSIITILGTIFYDEVNKLENPISFAYEGDKFNKFKLLTCTIVPNNNIVKFVILVISDECTFVLTLTDNIEKEDELIAFDNRVWESHEAPLPINSLRDCDSESSDLLISRTLSNEVSNKVSKVYSTVFDEMNEQVVGASLYYEGMLYKDVPLMFNSYMSDRHWLTLYLTKEGISCFN